VRAVVVIAREDSPGNKRLVAYYTTTASTLEIEAAKLREHASQVLAEYMVPAAYVALEAIPLTVNGKVDRKALPAPEEGAYASRHYEAPITEAEKMLAGLWGELLNVSASGGRIFLRARRSSLLAKPDGADAQRRAARGCERAVYPRHVRSPTRTPARPKRASRFQSTAYPQKAPRRSLRRCCRRCN
jgi:hypothetical protein